MRYRTCAHVIQPCRIHAIQLGVLISPKILYGRVVFLDVSLEGLFHDDCNCTPVSSRLHYTKTSNLMSRVGWSGAGECDTYASADTCLLVTRVTPFQLNSFEFIVERVLYR